MRILIDAHLSSEITDGIGRYLNELIYALLKVDQRNEYIALTNASISSDHPLSILEAPNLVKIPVKLHGLDWRQHFVIPRVIRQVKPDIYHHPHFDSPWPHKAPSVVTIHGLKYIQHPDFYRVQSGRQRVFFKRMYMKAMMAHSVKKAYKVIAVSKSVRDEIISVFNTSQDKVTVVYLGVKPVCQKGIDKADVSRLHKKYGIRGKYILAVCAQLPHKNLIRLIEAFDIFHSRNEDDYQLVIAGRSHSNYTRPHEKVLELALTDKVVFTEHLQTDELGLMYRFAELLVFPSLYEGFGLPVLEAMVNGTPVIASNQASLPEIVGNAGILVDPYNPHDIASAIEKIVTTPQNSEDLREKGMDWVKDFTWERTARRTLEVYEEIYNHSQGIAYR